jgi:UDP-2,4-diacetamido-2,4,6-trideoxy-beta-L-altropyranose hydrolase
MKCCILTEGGSEFGLGHIIRCTSFYDAFLERGYATEFIVHGDKSLQSILGARKHTFRNWHGKVNLLTDSLINFDVVLLDSFHVVQHDIDLLCNQSFTLVSIDDYLRNSYHDSIVIDWTINVEKSSVHEKNLNNGNVVLLGINNVVLRKPFWNFSNRRFFELTKVLLILGGNDFRELTLPLVKHLSTNFVDINFYVIVGNSTVLKKNMEILKKANLKIYESINSDKVKELMDNCDIAISAGGQTLYELASVGIPTIAIKIIENQSEDIEGWKLKGLLYKVIDWNDNAMLEKITDALNDLRPIEIRKRINSKVMNLVKGDNIYKIVELIEGRIYAKNRK